MLKCSENGCSQQVEFTPDFSQPSKRTEHICNPDSSNPEYGFIISHPAKVATGMCFYHNMRQRQAMEKQIA